VRARLAARLAAGAAAAALAGACAHAPPRDPATGVTAVTLNLWHDQHDWPARRAVIVDTLRALAPDVVLLQEVLEKPGLPNQAADLAERLGLRVVFASVDPPGAAKRYGNAILTPHPIASSREVRLAPFDDHRVALHARLVVRGRLLDAVVTHLHHTAEGGAIRAAQVRDLLAFVDATRGPGALILGGDFNAAPDEPELAPLRARFMDAFAAARGAAVAAGATTLNPAKGHAARRIDHLFAPPGTLRAEACEVILDAPAPDGTWASDHFGLWARFVWPWPRGVPAPPEPGGDPLRPRPARPGAAYRPSIATPAPRQPSPSISGSPANTEQRPAGGAGSAARNSPHVER